MRLRKTHLDLVLNPGSWVVSLPQGVFTVVCVTLPVVIFVALADLYRTGSKAAILARVATS
jgi:hypothetical protein